MSVYDEWTEGLGAAPVPSPAPRRGSAARNAVMSVGVVVAIGAAGYGAAAALTGGAPAASPSTTSSIPSTSVGATPASTPSAGAIASASGSSSTTSSSAATGTQTLKSLPKRTVGGDGGRGPGGFGGGDGQPPAASGTVASVGSHRFTLTSLSGAKMTVVVSASTTYRDRAVLTASFANVTVAQQVSVRGTTSAGVVHATSVSIGIGRGDGGRFGGPGGN